jgi:hypothetical protein
MTDTYAPTAYRPDRIPQQQPSAERSWLGKFAKMRLPWGNTQELAPAKFFYQDTPEDLQLGEQVKAEDETKKANGTYEPRITETMDFHYVHDHQRHRFAQLAIGGRFWTTLYTFGKWGFIFMILPTLIGVLSVFPLTTDLSSDDLKELINILLLALGIPLGMV